MWGGGGMWVRSDVTSGRNRRWESRPDTGDAEDGKTTSDASGPGARASEAALIFADGPYQLDAPTAFSPPHHLIISTFSPVMDARMFLLQAGNCFGFQ